MSDVIARFCGEYHDYHAISPARRKMQLRVLREFEATLAPRPIEQAQPDDLRRYLAACVAGGLHPNTVRQRLNAIRPLLTWMRENKLLDAERLLDFREVRPPRGASGQSTPKPYTRKEILRFYSELEQAYPWSDRGKDGTRIDTAEMYLRRWRSGSSKWPRVQPYAKRLQLEAILVLALHGALRRDEIFNLDLEELHPDNDYLVVRKTARKNRDGHASEAQPRVVPWMSTEMRRAVGAWLEFRTELGAEHDRPWLSLHQGHRLKPMRHRQFEMLLCDIGTGWEFHRMRHTAATNMLRSGMALEKASPILGHTRLEQTRAYVKLISDDLVKAAAGVQSAYSEALAREAA